jgi:hypothetical protein
MIALNAWMFEILKDFACYKNNNLIKALVKDGLLL